MKTYVFWTAITGPQYSVMVDYWTGIMQACALIQQYKHTHAYLYDSADQTWVHYTKGARGRVNECEIPEDEVPKVYRLLLTLEG